ncbi:MAG: methyltetrahydrofolate cobalamin methyltransferase [Deltaproteobacteria bacterium]|nr:methyltetrahydrofolate cobalamin methyltransferase [Deltaproteobacteria bacterium]MBW2124021.1 methyltetrahydrofolate cobalamin methyltransferase [Deltaproteobacteria bacterium]
MLIVGERINASRKAIKPAIENRDADFIVKEAEDQVKAGAHLVDVNAGVFVNKEVEYLPWLVETIQARIDVPLCLDSPDPKAIEAALAVHKGQPMINSISLEQKRFEEILPLVGKYKAKVVALCMTDKGMPKTAGERFDVATQLIEKLTQAGIPLDDIYVDPLVMAVSTDSSFGIEFLRAVRRIMEGHEGVHTICGLSNISYGLPLRKQLNQIFAVMAMAMGLDSLIIDPLDRKMMADILTAETLLGVDAYCAGYLKAYREGRLEA